MSSAASLQSRSKPANFREASNLRRKSWKYKFSDLILTPHNVTYFKIIKMCNLKTVMIAANYIELVILSKFPKIAHYDITCPLMLHATGSNLPGK